MATGTIKKLTDKGFGFIAIEGEEKDLFFHANELHEDIEFNDLKEGDELNFEVDEGGKGPHAVEVTRV